MKFIMLLLLLTKPIYAFEILNSKVIDLSHDFDKNTIYWPNSPINFELKKQSYGVNSKGFFYSSNSFCAPEHGEPTLMHLYTFLRRVKHWKKYL